MTDQSLEVLLRDRGALLTGHFQLSSGLHSDQYVQCARLFEDPRDAERLGRDLAALAPSPAELVVSPALGAILIGYEVARALGLPFQFTERVDGAMALRRGFKIPEGTRILIVEDVLTTGKSTIEAAETVRAAGGRPVGVLSVINRGCDSASLGLPAQSLIDLPLRTYVPQACPLCAAGEPMEKPGSRPNPRIDTI